MLALEPRVFSHFPEVLFDEDLVTRNLQKFRREAFRLRGELAGKSVRLDVGHARNMHEPLEPGTAATVNMKASLMSTPAR